MKPGSIIRRGVAAVAAASLVLAASAPATALTVYTAVEAEDLKKYAARFNEDHPNIEIKWFAIPLHRHREAPRGEGQPQGRRHLGAGGDEPPAHEVGGHAAPLQTEGHRKARPEVRRQGRPSGVDRHGRVGRGDLREHGGAGQARVPDTDVVEGSHQARVQGPRRDAESEFVRHRLPRRLELAANFR